MPAQPSLPLTGIRNHFPPEVRPGAVLEVDRAVIDLLKPAFSLRFCCQAVRFVSCVDQKSRSRPGS